MDINNTLINACENGDLSTVKECLEHGANIHVWDDWALRCAAADGRLEVVKYLIKQGANIHADKDDALWWAAYEGHLQVANAFRKAAGNKYKCHKCIIKSTCLKLCDGFRQY